MVTWLKQPQYELSIREPFLKTSNIKTWEEPNITSLDNYKWTSIIKTSLIAATITHSSWSICLRSHLWYKTYIPNPPPNPALTQPTSPLTSDPHFDKSNFVCPIVTSSDLKPTYTLLPSCISWPLIPCSTHPPFTPQTSDVPNHVAWATNSGYTKPHACIPSLGAQHVPNHVPILDRWPGYTIPQKDIMAPYMVQTRYPLNSQLLAIFFSFTTIPVTTLHYPEFTDRYSAQSFSLHFLTNTFFRHSSLPPPSFSHSPDLGCVGAQRILFVGRFLV